MRTCLRLIRLRILPPATWLLISLSFSLVTSYATVGAAPSTATTQWRLFLGSPTVMQPTGMAIDLRGPKHAAQWGYVADAASGKIVKFGTGGHILRTWRYSAPGHAAVLAVGGSGNLFVADRVSGTITKFSPSGQRLALWPPTYFTPLFMPALTDPRSMAVDPSGKIYVAEYSAHRIIQLSPGGTLLQTWDTWKGFPMQTAVPEQNSGSLGDPTGVVYDPPGHLFVSTVCGAVPACPTDRFTPVPNDGHDTLFVLNIAGPFSGHIGNLWFGLGYSQTGVPSEMPGKESEAFVHIDAMAGDGKGRTYLAGTMWPRGGQAGLGVLSYTDTGFHRLPWRVSTSLPISGVAVDGAGSAYISQGSSIFVRSPAGSGT